MSSNIHSVTVQDAWIEAPRGRLFARIWTPDLPTQRVPVVLLHDSLGSVELWRGFPEALARATGRQVIAYDRLGFGKSDPHPARLGLDFVAREADTDFAVVVGQLGIARFILFGHSVGGGMAVYCAAHFGDACVALVTESAQGFVEDRTVEGIEDAQTLFQDPEQVGRLKRYHGEKASWVLDAWINSWLHPEFATWSLEPVLPQVKCPVLAIHGAEDEYGSPRHPELIASLSSGPAQLEIMADTRHVPHREKEAEVIALLQRFMAPLP